MEWLTALIYTIGAIVVIGIIAFFIYKLFKGGRGSKGVSVEVGKDGVKLSANQEDGEEDHPEITTVVGNPRDYVDMDHDAYLASLMIIREVQKLITIHTDIIMYKQQMDYVERQLRELKGLISDHFDEWLEFEGITGDAYFELRAENQKFLTVIYDYLHVNMKNAVFKNGYSAYAPELLDEYVTSTTNDWLKQVGEKRKHSTSHPERIREYLKYADRNYKQYKSMIDDMFQHTGTIHHTIKQKVRCYEQFIQKHKEAFKKGELLEFHEGCIEP